MISQPAESHELVDRLRERVFRELYDLIFANCTLSDLALRVLQVSTAFCSAVLTHIRHHHLEFVRPLLVAPFQLQPAQLFHEKVYDCGWAGRRPSVTPLQFSTFSKACSGGALPKLIFLGLSCNKIGDVGMHEFAAALKNGALPLLEVLDLSENEIRDDGMLCFSTTLGKGVLSQLTELHLDHNEIGHLGMCAFATALGDGALSQLRSLDLGCNQILGDAGLAAFVSAIVPVTEGGNGALPQLQDFWLDGPTQGLAHACGSRGIRLNG